MSSIVDSRVLTTALSNSQPPLKGFRPYRQGLISKDQDSVLSLVSTLADSSWFNLLTNQSSLESKGNSLAHVHPLNLIEFLATDEKAFSKFSYIKVERSMVWKIFAKSLRLSLDNEKKKLNVEPYISEFCSRIGISEDLGRKHIQAHDIDNLVQAIIKRGCESDR
ncbi:MAG: hypothetical protein S4CHLAM7_12180 [Chlamydiae bacterium]|nr:hypothetical protein [Chlamydiota bacterium]